jgi:hypothetical protein
MYFSVARLNDPLIDAIFRHFYPRLPSVAHIINFLEPIICAAKILQFFQIYKYFY